MDNFETITYLGTEQGKRLKPIETPEELKKGVPWFRIQGREVTSFGGHIGHDNADRLPFFTQYLTTNVLPHVEALAKLDGYYNIELHDTYSYLKNGIDYRNCLTWSKRKEDRDVILLPDLYHICNFGDKLQKHVDTLDWASKPCDRIGFWGTTTGERDPKKNERLKMCDWSVDHPETEFYITKVAQMDAKDVQTAYPRFDEFSSASISPETMFDYKFLLDIPGNTCSWDRVPLVLNSKSLLFKMPCRDMCFYYPLLHSGTHFASVNTFNMLNQRKFYLSNPRIARFMTECANKFATDFLHARHALMYTVGLFEGSSWFNGS